MHPHLARARKLASLFFVVSIAAVAPACDLFFPASRTDAGPIDAPDVSFPWRLGTVNRGPHAPGTWLHFPVEGVTVPASEVYLWVIEEDLAFPMRTTYAGVAPFTPQAVSEEDAGPPDAGQDAGGDAGSSASYLFVAPLPIVRAGVFHLAVGTVDAPMTRRVEVEVRLSGETMTQAEAADAIGAGLAGLTADVGQALHSEDPEWQALVADAEMAEVLTAFDGMADDLDDLAALAREEYLALPTEVEPGLQEFLSTSGMLDALAARASGVSMLTFGGGPLDSAVLRSPFQALLFTLDALSLLLATFGIVCDVAAILGAVLTAPVGAEGAVIGIAPKILVAVLRVIIDNVVPTDLTQLFEIQSSRVVYETEGSMVAPWGVFAPQNRMAGSVFRSFEDIVLVLIEAVAPGGSGRGARVAVERAGEYVLTHLPGLGADFMFQRIDIPHIELAMPVDMGFYNIQLSQILRLNPALIPLAEAVAAIHDPEIVTPYSGSFPRDGRVNTAYDTFSVGFTDIDWRSASPTERTPSVLSARAFAFASDGREAFNVQLVQFPLPYTVEATRFFQVQQAPDPADRNARISDEDFIVLDVNLVGGGTTRIVRPSTTTTRVHPLWIDDLAGGRPDQTVVDVLVNGTVQFASAVVPDGTVLQLPLTLQPGVNEVRVVATSGHTIGCGPSSTDPVCLEITFPEADNVNLRYVAYGSVGVSRDVRVWTPPTFPPPEM